ncbi:MAG TPA: GldG family protein [Candidatus Limiplasma sp.]|nr:GldG family protein [Candidatus Limiplasma sp.]HPS80447.1 GldG family protein [Candidatus Limiplasma sp.]
MKKQTQKGLWTAVLLLALCVFGLVNLCATFAAKRFQTALDLTEENLYALSADTQKAVAGLENETNVYVFSAEADYPAMLREMLRRYTQLSDQLRVTYVDPTENPVLMTHYQQMGATLDASDILVEGAARIKAIPYADLILYTDNQPTGIDLEQQLTSALLYVNSSYAPRAVFTTGHGERPTSALQKLFTDNQFSVETVAIGVEDAQQPEVMVIAAPATDFTATDVTALQNYLGGGGKLMVFLEPTDAAMPNLNGFLSALGMAVQPDIVFEPKAYASGSPHNIIPMYTSSAVNAYFADHPVYVVMPSASAITLSASANGQQAEALLSTTADSYAKTDLRYTASEKAEGDVTGPFTVAAMADGKVFLAASRMMYADDLMGADSYANRMFLTQALGALWQQSTVLSLPARRLESATLPITGYQANLLAIALTGALPLMALAVGFAVKWRRRRL